MISLACRLITGCCVCVAAVPAFPGERAVLAEGPWRAWLDSPGGDLPFGLELHRDREAWRATIANGDERIKIPIVTFDDAELVLDIDYYDSSIRARTSNDGTRLDGTWKKKGRGDKWSELSFHAEAGRHPHFAGPDKRQPAPRGAGDRCASIAGRWSVAFDSSDDPAIGVFDQHDGAVTGTFLTTTGDYRFLAGHYDNGSLQLSGFDGAHAFLFHAGCQPGGTLTGDFWSRDTWHETWTARRDPNASLPDAFALTSAPDRVNLSKIRFPNAEGVVHALGEPGLDGKVYILDIFGTWCPNCSDASNYLQELHQRYAARGVRVVGLAFELTGDFERDARQVKRYVKRHGIEYPVLIAGEAVRERVAQVLPIIDRLRAYPTLVFVDARGQVRAVYTGFSGPATGEANTKLRRDIETRIETLLSQ